MGCFEQITQSVQEQILQSPESQNIKDKLYPCCDKIYYNIMDLMQ